MEPFLTVLDPTLRGLIMVAPEINSISSSFTLPDTLPDPRKIGEESGSCESDICLWRSNATLPGESPGIGPQWYSLRRDQVGTCDYLLFNYSFMKLHQWAMGFFEEKWIAQFGEETRYSYENHYVLFTERFLNHLGVYRNRPSLAKLRLREVNKIASTIEDQIDRMVFCTKDVKQDPGSSPSSPNLVRKLIMRTKTHDEDSYFEDFIEKHGGRGEHFLEQFQMMAPHLFLLERIVSVTYELVKYFFPCSSTPSAMRERTLSSPILLRTPSRRSSMISASSSPDSMEDKNIERKREVSSIEFFKNMLGHRRRTSRYNALLSGAAMDQDCVAQSALSWLEGLSWTSYQEKYHGTLSEGVLAQGRCLDMLCCNMVYLADILTQQIEQKKEKEITFSVYLEGGRDTRYYCARVFNLWRSVICCAFMPYGEGDGPPILCFRGTQKSLGIPGFFSNVSALMHRDGPGANILESKSEERSALFRWLDQHKEKDSSNQANKVLLCGHSMGGNIALDLFLKQSDYFSKIYTFGSPGRNERLFENYQRLIGKDSDLYKRIYQFVHWRDPLCHIGRVWLGQTWVVDSDLHRSTESPLDLFEAIGRFHARPLLFRKDLIVWKMSSEQHMMPGFPWIRSCHIVANTFLSPFFFFIVYGAEATFLLASSILRLVRQQEAADQLQAIAKHFFS